MKEDRTVREILELVRLGNLCLDEGEDALKALLASKRPERKKEIIGQPEQYGWNAALDAIDEAEREVWE